MSSNELQFIVCPSCSGTGRGRLGFACSNCGGMGLGMFYKGRFLYWGLRLSRAVIEIDHLRKKIFSMTNFLATAVSVLGILSLAFWFYLTAQETRELENFLFWQHRHYLVFFFWLSCLADMFVVYRVSETRRRENRIEKWKESSDIRKMPNNWDELKASSARIRIDVSRGMDAAAIEIIEQAYILSNKLRHEQTSPIHIFFSCLADTQVTAMFSRLNVDGLKLLEKIKSQLSKITPAESWADFSPAVRKLLIMAYIQAHELEQSKVTPKNFITACMENEEVVREILYEFEVDHNKIFNVILWFVVNDKMIENYRAFRRAAHLKPGKNMDRAYTSVATPTLNQFAYDLTVAAKWGRLEYCVARDEEINKIFQHFESGHRGVILTGQPGVGKNTIINGIAQLMVKEQVPPFFRDKRLVELDSSRLISGATPADAQGRMMAIIDEVAHAGNIVLFIRNVENMIGITSGQEESLDLSEVLAGELERGNIFCIASSKSEDYVQYIEGKSLGDVLVRVEIPEPVGNQAIQIIESRIGYFEGKYKVYFSYNAIENVINLSRKYIHDKYLPAKAINLLELVAVRVAKQKGPQSLVTPDDIAEAISEATGIPVTKVSASEGQSLLHLEDKIHERMIGQHEAVEMVASSLRRARAELRENKRPIANFLFLGPTGVGKTELAKTVSEIYFGDEKYMIRLDMSEYQHPDSVKKMIGDVDGTGYLTEAVRKSPFALILLDEIEKSHPDILNLFLQVMDDGRLTDGRGRTVDFTNAIIIATSNAGANYIQEQIFAGTDVEIIKTALINEHLNKVMRPELINRFDGVIVFEPLSMENVVDIARLMLRKIGKMLDLKGIGFRLSEDGLRILAKEGYDPKFGARPLRRLLQDKIENEIANKILAGDVKRRDVLVINDQAEVSVEKAREI